MGTITGLVKHTIVLGTGQYGDAVTVGGSGDVAPVVLGSNGIDLRAGASHGRVANLGTITAAAGAYGTTQGRAGGIGIDFAAFGHVRNAGAITGGAGGGTGSGGIGGQGGAGITLSDGGDVRNSGQVAGGTGGASPVTGTIGLGGTGGIGVDLTSGGSVVNTGAISGGYGGDSASAYLGGFGGVGVALSAGGTLSNHGTISGGTGGTSRYAGGTSGAAVYLNGATLKNTGLLSGGAGNGYNYSDAPGAGGVGAILVRSVASNSGSITGGQGGDGFSQGSSGGVGIDLTLRSTLDNSGTIAGGAGGSDYSGYISAAGGTGIYLAGASTLTNSGTITGGLGLFNGAIGAAITGTSSVVNSGIIAGGAGLYRVGGNGGTGVVLQSGSLQNTGTVTGGQGGKATYIRYDGNVMGGTGGTGIVISYFCSVVDDSRIAGGAGGQGYNAYSGLGGVGVELSGGVLTVSSGASVTGGQGGGGEGSYAAISGAAGVDVTSYGHVNNYGIISGGQGGNAYQNSSTDRGGDGGVGVYLNGGTLTNAGTISGGMAGLGAGGNGQAGDAVLFGSQASTLMLDQGAAFNGLVVAGGSGDDALQLAPSASNSDHPVGLLNGLGSAFTGFASVFEYADADWVLAGANVLGSATRFVIDGSLSVTGSLTDMGSFTVLDDGFLQGSGNGVAELSSLSLVGGIIGGGVVVGVSLAGAQAGVTMIDQGASISGYGTIGNSLTSVVDNGIVTSSGGTLSFDCAVTGSGQAVVDQYATLVINGTQTSIGVGFAQGGHETLTIGLNASFISPDSISGTLSGFGAGDVIDVQYTKLTSLHFVGGTLSLMKGPNVIERLDFAGHYDAADFQLSSDGDRGTDISFAGTAAMAGLASPLSRTAFPRADAASVLRDIAGHEAGSPQGLFAILGHLHW